MVIDAHHHFWQYSAAEYGWISDSMSILKRDFLPADLAGETCDARHQRTGDAVIAIIGFDKSRINSSSRAAIKGIVQMCA